MELYRLIGLIIGSLNQSGRKKTKPKGKMMQAVVFKEPGVVEIDSVLDPALNENEVIIKVNRAGICGTDLHIFNGEYTNRFPIIAGHEFVGTIVEIGKKVSQFNIGDRVAVDPNLSCGQCYFCQREQSNHCLNWQGIGITRSGGFAQFVNVPTAACYLVPEEISDSQAAFIEPLSCVVYALNRMRVSAGDDVLIFGAGPMGLLLVQAMRNSGVSHIAVIEKDASRRKIAKQMGASSTMELTENTTKHFREIVPFGFDIVIDATGSPSVIEQALQFLKPNGQYLQFGVAPQKSTVKWNPYEIFKNDWTILGSFALRYTFHQAISWFKSGRIDVIPLISHTLPLSQFKDGFTDFVQGKSLKVHIVQD
jgi:2-desacetyl-2-hydroxyethyl bacteriochlorophyllide A dehydrogenase